jgi:hypothetical protein
VQWYLRAKLRRLNSQTRRQGGAYSPVNNCNFIVRKCLTDLPGFDVILAVIAGVDESVLALVVQLVQHGHCGVLGSPQGRKFVVLVSSQRQKCISSIHQIALDEWVRILDRLF